MERKQNYYYHQEIIKSLVIIKGVCGLQKLQKVDDFLFICKNV